MFGRRSADTSHSISLAAQFPRLRLGVAQVIQGCLDDDTGMQLVC